MTLAEFRRLTAHLAGERELLCAGAEIGILWHDEVDIVSVDDDRGWSINLDDDATVIYGHDFRGESDAMRPPELTEREKCDSN